MTSIDRGTFSYCSGLMSITIPNGLTTINDNVFANCTALTNITIPNSVNTIDSYAFVACASLRNLTLPSTVTNLGSGMYQNYQDPQKSLTLLSVTPPTVSSPDPFNCPIDNLIIYVPA